jgi:galactose-1-phosphate uridylyltransferase
LPIEFEKRILCSKFLDPTEDFKEISHSFEERADPLTGHTIVVRQLPIPRMKKPDLSGLIAKSLERNCPFCPSAIEEVTPKFPLELVPEGRIRLAQAWVIPNSVPYAPYSAIGVFSEEHFLDLPDFGEEMLTHGFLASQIYLKRVLKHDPEAKYCSVNWNYMPPAGGSQVHPHLQILASYSPSRYQRELLEASKRYCEENGTNFWADLIDKEQELGERYIGSEGNTLWLTSFVPRGILGDVMAIFREQNSFLSVSQKELQDFCRGLRKIFASMTEQGFWSFNLSIYSGIMEQEYFWTHARLVPRFLLPPFYISDCNYLRLLHGELATVRTPEDICGELRKYFRT